MHMEIEKIRYLIDNNALTRVLELGDPSFSKKLKSSVHPDRFTNCRDKTIAEQIFKFIGASKSKDLRRLLASILVPAHANVLLFSLTLRGQGSDIQKDSDSNAGLFFSSTYGNSVASNKAPRI